MAKITDKVVLHILGDSQKALANYHLLHDYAPGANCLRLIACLARVAEEYKIDCAEAGVEEKLNDHLHSEIFKKGNVGKNAASNIFTNLKTKSNHVTMVTYFVQKHGCSAEDLLLDTKSRSKVRATKKTSAGNKADEKANSPMRVTVIAADEIKSDFLRAAIKIKWVCQDEQKNPHTFITEHTPKTPACSAWQSSIKDVCHWQKRQIPGRPASLEVNSDGTVFFTFTGQSIRGKLIS